MLGFAASALCESHTIPGLEKLGHVDVGDGAGGVPNFAGVEF